MVCLFFAMNGLLQMEPSLKYEWWCLPVFNVYGRLQFPNVTISLLFDEIVAWRCFHFINDLPNLMDFDWVWIDHMRISHNAPWLGQHTGTSTKLPTAQIVKVAQLVTESNFPLIEMYFRICAKDLFLVTFSHYSTILKGACEFVNFVFILWRLWYLKSSYFFL